MVIVFLEFSLMCNKKCLVHHQMSQLKESIKIIKGVLPVSLKESCSSSIGVEIGGQLLVIAVEDCMTCGTLFPHEKVCHYYQISL